MSVKEWILLEKIDDIETSIKQVKEFFQIELPNDFIQCIRENNAGCPLPNNFYIGNNGEVFNNLLSFDMNSRYSILKVFNMLKDRLPDKVIPIARDPFGNYICFDYRNGDNPIVVFWTHEMESTIKKVCDTFTELLDMLEEYEEEELY